jgi:transcriptional regulator with XRE-family HTH domain
LIGFDKKAMNDLGIHIRLKEARKQLNVNQLIIATDLGIHQKTISEIENGKILNIPNTYIYYFYKNGVSLDWLYTGKGEMMITGDDIEPQMEIKSSPFSDSLFENRKIPSEKSVPASIDTAKDGLQNSLYERIIDSKEFSIKSLMAYVQSLENNLSFIKQLLLSKK